jgi:hypothetical protein
MAKKKKMDVEMPSGLIQKRESDYMAEEDHRTLTRADEIRNDAARMKGVQRHHAKQTAALDRVGKALKAEGRNPVRGARRAR